MGEGSAQARRQNWLGHAQCGRRAPEALRRHFRLEVLWPVSGTVSGRRGPGPGSGSGPVGSPDGGNSEAPGSGERPKYRPSAWREAGAATICCGLRQRRAKLGFGCAHSGAARGGRRGGSAAATGGFRAVYWDVGRANFPLDVFYIKGRISPCPLQSVDGDRQVSAGKRR